MSRWCPSCEEWVPTYGDDWEAICQYCDASTYPEKPEDFDSKEEVDDSE